MNRIKFLKFWSIGVGAMDACTGLLLIFAPMWTLELMRIPAIDANARVFLSWMGVLIMGVGISYALVFRGNREGETVWISTATVRLLVAAFLVWKISTGLLAPSWGLVAMTDFVVAAVQAILLRAGCWKGEEG